MVPQLGRLKVMKGWMICACSNPWLPKGRSKKAQIASLHHGFAVGFDNFLSFRAGAICMLGAVRIKILHPHEAFWWAAPPWTWWQDFRQSGHIPIGIWDKQLPSHQGWFAPFSGCCTFGPTRMSQGRKGLPPKKLKESQGGHLKIWAFQDDLFIGHCLFSGFHDL